MSKFVTLHPVRSDMHGDEMLVRPKTIKNIQVHRKLRQGDQDSAGDITKMVVTFYPLQSGWASDSMECEGDENLLRTLKSLDMGE